MARFDEERIIDFDSWQWMLVVTGYIVTIAFGSYLAVQVAVKFESNLFALLFGTLTAVLCQVILWFGLKVQTEDSQPPPSRWDRVFSIVNLGLVMLFIWYVSLKRLNFSGVEVRPSELAISGLVLGTAIVSTFRSFGFFKVRRKLGQQ